MTDRQRALYTDVVDLYQPVSLAVDADRGVEGPEFPSVPTAAGVMARLMPSSEASIPLPIGRSNYDIVQTTDVLRVAIETEIDDGWAVQLKTPGHPEEGTWFMTQGGVRSFNWRAGSKTIYIKRSTRPAAPIIP